MSEFFAIVSVRSVVVAPRHPPTTWLTISIIKPRILLFVGVPAADCASHKNGSSSHQLYSFSLYAVVPQQQFVYPPGPALFGFQFSVFAFYLLGFAF